MNVNVVNINIIINNDIDMNINFIDKISFHLSSVHFIK